MEFATGSIGLPPTNRLDWGDVTDLMWPSYRRITSMEGGDLEASFSFTAAADDLFAHLDYLFAPFTEMYEGVVTFSGFVHEMRLVTDYLHVTYSLDSVFNRVACRYRSVLTGATNVTQFFEDAASQATWGRRTLILPMIEPIDLVEAEAVAQQFLAENAQPRLQRAGLARMAEVPTMKVVVRGWATLLDADLYHFTSPGSANASDEVAATLAGNGAFVTAGSIASNTRPVSVQANYRPRLERLKGIAQVRDSLGRPYRFGCFGSAQFDYQPVEPVARYRVHGDGSGSLTHEDLQLASHVPAPLVQPGGWSVLVDASRNAQPAADAVTAQPNAQLDQSVLYQNGLAVLQGANRDERSRIEGLMMAAIAKRTY